MIRYGDPPYLECSSRGDKRFSAFYAKVDGKSIEEHYQSAKKLPWARKDVHWREKIGKHPSNEKYCRELYSNLWDRYMYEHRELWPILTRASGLSDIFGKPGHCCQAAELWRIRKSIIEKGTI